MKKIVKGMHPQPSGNPSPTTTNIWTSRTHYLNPTDATIVATRTQSADNSQLQPVDKPISEPSGSDVTQTRPAASKKITPPNAWSQGPPTSRQTWKPHKPGSN